MHVRPVTLEGNWVRLEPLGEQHVEDLVVAADEDDIWTWMPIRSRRQTIFGHGWRPRMPIRRREPRCLCDHRAGVRQGGRINSLHGYPTVNRGLEIGWTWLAKQVRRTPVNTECKYLAAEPRV